MIDIVKIIIMVIMAYFLFIILINVGLTRKYTQCIVLQTDCQKVYDEYDRLWERQNPTNKEK